MRTVYLDSGFICHLHPVENSTVYETDFFDDKCDAFIEGYRIIPEGQSWVRNDGVSFSGPMISPAVSYKSLALKQEQYEEDCQNMMPLDEVAELVDALYESDLEMIG